jgi:putative selenate reductase
MELIPAPFPHLLRRMVREHSREGKVFDLPARKFWRGAPDLDLRVSFHGRPAGNPLGPAAGPQDQMAQNVVLAWLAGSRILELKTVQVNDRLVLPRPCIDATNVGYNVEWSQELRLAESLREYVAGSMLVDVLRSEGTGAAATDTIFDMSVGYDLAGVRSAPVRAWMESMVDASAHVASLRAQIPDDLARFRDVAFRERLSDQVTLSTFHGCPASEIEGIARFLLTEMGVHVTVKLNPTLLGRPAVDGLLHDVMGYREIETRAQDFDKDLQWAEALEITDRLSELARSLGRTFQVKFSNTLVVRNHRSFFPSSEAVMYLSGAPLHVITLNLVEKYRRARPDVPISFSAGVDGQNFPECVALGFTPITTCTDLLRPGGYGRLPAYLARLEERMRALGVRTIGDFVIQSGGRAEQAIADVVPPGPLRDHVPAALYPAVVARAAVLNTPGIVARATADPRYHAAQNASLPRKIGSFLVVFDCINCDKCIPVCPNDANFSYEVAPFRAPYEHFVVRAGAVARVPAGVFEVVKQHQIANFQDFCNECGNCDVFCPEDGGPYIEKPRFFGSHDAFRAMPVRDGFFAARAPEGAWIVGRMRGSEYRLDVDARGEAGTFTDGSLTVDVRHRDRVALAARVTSATPEGHVLDFSAYLNLAVILDGVLDTRRANPVNAPWL